MTDKAKKSEKAEVPAAHAAIVPTFDAEGGSAAVGARLAQVRDAMGMTQAEMAPKVGVGPRTLARYEAGETAPGTPTLAGLARLGIDLNWLVTGEGSPRRDAQPAPAPEDGTPPLLEDLLENVIRSVELYLESAGLGLAPDRKARLVVVLYRILARRRARRAAEGQPFPAGEAGAVIRLDGDPDLLDTVRLAL